jgi:hypothetical protein
MGFCRYRRRSVARFGTRSHGSAVGAPDGGDGKLPRCKGFCLSLPHRAVLRRCDAAGRVSRHLQFPRPLVETRREVRRQPVEAVHHGPKHPAAVREAQDAAIVGPPFGAVAAVDGARGGDADAAVLSARTGAAAAMHAAAEFSSDRRGAARAVGAGAGAAAGS